MIGQLIFPGRPATSKPQATVFEHQTCNLGNLLNKLKRICDGVAMENAGPSWLRKSLCFDNRRSPQGRYDCVPMIVTEPFQSTGGYARMAYIKLGLVWWYDSMVRYRVWKSIILQCIAWCVCSLCACKTVCLRVCAWLWDCVPVSACMCLCVTVCLCDCVRVIVRCRSVGPGLWHLEHADLFSHLQGMKYDRVWFWTVWYICLQWYCKANWLDISYNAA